MLPVVQPAPRRIVSYSSALAARAAFALCVLLFIPGLIRAQDAPASAVGRVEGLDVTVDGGVPAGSGLNAATPGIFITNGGVVTVHSGQAHLTLVAGGQVDICGPAKLTVLQSSGAITLALNFGRMRIQLPAATALRIFTPTIIATPLDISGAARDVTIGLDLNDSLCVLAAGGALQLEHQFTGEKLVVPQAGEFFLAEGKLLPVVGAAGSCQCQAMQARVAEPPQTIPEAGLTAPPVTAEPPAPSADKTPAPEPQVEFSIPAHNSDSHPIAAAKKAAPAAPPVSMPEYKVVMPPLTFSASSPAPPPDPGADMILLVRVAHLVPEWEFTGHVDAPRLEAASMRTHSSQPQGQSAQISGQRKGGFWAALKRFFVGSKPQN